MDTYDRISGTSHLTTTATKASCRTTRLSRARAGDSGSDFSFGDRVILHRTPWPHLPNHSIVKYAKSSAAKDTRNETTAVSSKAAAATAIASKAPVDRIQAKATRLPPDSSREARVAEVLTICVPYRAFPAPMKAIDAGPARENRCT